MQQAHSLRSPWAWLPLVVLGGLWLVLRVMPPWNLSAFFAINHWAQQFEPAVWSHITVAGDTLAALALLALGAPKRPHWIPAALLCVILGGILVHGLKALAGAPRPLAVLDPTLFTVIGKPLHAGSFPSGHTATAFATAAIVWVGLGSRRGLWALLLLPLAGLIGVSRVAVGAHWPEDVAMGALLGWLTGVLSGRWSATWVMSEQTTGASSRQSIYLLISALIAIGVGVAMFSARLGYPLADPFKKVLGAASVLAGLMCLGLWVAAMRRARALAAGKST